MTKVSSGNTLGSLDLAVSIMPNSAESGSLVGHQTQMARSVTHQAPTPTVRTVSSRQHWRHDRQQHRYREPAGSSGPGPADLFF